MKLLSFIFALLVLTSNVNSQEDTLKKRPFSILIGGGVNWETHPNSNINSHGINFAEDALRLGYFAEVGTSYDFKNRININLQIAFRTQGRNSDQFSEQFIASHPDKLLYLRSDIASISRIGVRLSFGYQFKLKSLNINPKLGIGISAGPITSYNYVLRTPATNYFDRYSVRGVGAGENPLSLAISFSHQKLEEIEFTTTIGYSRESTTYEIKKIELDEPYNAPVIASYNLAVNRLFFGLGVNFKLQEAQP